MDQNTGTKYYRLNISLKSQSKIQAKLYRHDLLGNHPYNS